MYRSSSRATILALRSTRGSSLCPFSPKCPEVELCELPLYGVLRRLMSNSGRRRRSRTLMLVPNLRQKVVPHVGSRLLVGLIVRARGRLVARAPSPVVPAQQARPSGPAVRIGSPHPRHPLPMAPLPQREGLLALRPGAPARILPHVVHPRPNQPAHPSSRARVVRVAAGLRRGSCGTFGRLPRDRHHPGASDGEGEGFSQGAVRRSGVLREECLQDRVGLRVQGGFGGGPERGGDGLRVGPSGLRRAPDWGSLGGTGPLRCLLGRQGFHGTRVGAALDGDLRGAGGRPPVRGLPQGVVGGGSPLGYARFWNWRIYGEEGL